MSVQFMVTLLQQHGTVSDLTALDTVGSYQITEDTHDNEPDCTDAGDDDDEADNEVFSDVTGLHGGHYAWW